MRSTLFYIPHADPIFGIPVFGIGWMLALLTVSSLALIGVRVRRHGSKGEMLSELPLFLLLGVAIIWGAPLVEERTATGIPVGIPIRGYGMFVLLGIVLSASLMVHESRRMGLHPDLMMSLAFWMVLTGFVGGRAFYVMEYWPQFSEPNSTALEILANIGKLTDGGLVVYGSFIGASITVLVFVRKHKLPLLAIADLLGPGLMLGVAFGRLGCFMNGCCFGGYCDQESAIGATFPQGSPPYIAQIEDGSLLDMRLERNPDRASYTIRQVEPGGRGDGEGLKVGDIILQIHNPDETAFNRMRHGEEVPDAELFITLRNGRRIDWKFGDLPDRTKRIYPTQVLSCINAALICLFLWSYYPSRRRDGEVAALLASIYPITRILLEKIRNDEGAFLEFDLFATHCSMTISQTISAALLIGVIGLWFYVLTRPKGSALPLRDLSATPSDSKN